MWGVEKPREAILGCVYAFEFHSPLEGAVEKVLMNECFT